MEIVFISTPSLRNSSIPPAQGTVDLGYCELLVVRKASDRIRAPHQEVPPSLFSKRCHPLSSGWAEQMQLHRRQSGWKEKTRGVAPRDLTGSAFAETPDNYHHEVAKDTLA